MFSASCTFGTLTKRIFTAADTDLLEIVAERVAVALERSLVHEELLSLDNLKREFISVAAHEVRTPATVIYGVAETLAHRRKSLDPSEVDALVEAFYDASVRLARLTEELLDYSRVEGYWRELQLEPLNLRSVISQAVLGLSAHGERQIENLIPDSMTIESDRDALERIVGNLVGNALVHGAPPGPHRRRGWQRSPADHRYRPRPGRTGWLRLAPLRSLLPLSGIERQGRRGPRPGDRALVHAAPGRRAALHARQPHGGNVHARVAHVLKQRFTARTTAPPPIQSTTLIAPYG